MCAGMGVEVLSNASPLIDQKLLSKPREGLFVSYVYGKFKDFRFCCFPDLVAFQLSDRFWGVRGNLLSFMEEFIYPNEAELKRQYNDLVEVNPNANIHSASSDFYLKCFSNRKKRVGGLFLAFLKI